MFSLKLIDGTADATKLRDRMYPASLKVTIFSKTKVREILERYQVSLSLASVPTTVQWCRQRRRQGILGLYIQPHTHHTAHNPLYHGVGTHKHTYETCITHTTYITLRPKTTTLKQCARYLLGLWHFQLLVAFNNAGRFQLLVALNCWSLSIAGRFQ